jgi:hypothetical protein
VGGQLAQVQQNAGKILFGNIGHPGSLRASTTLRGQRRPAVVTYELGGKPHFRAIHVNDHRQANAPTCYLVLGSDRFALRTPPSMHNVLSFYHFLNTGPFDELSQSNGVKKRGDLITQISPQLMRKAALPFLTVLAAATARGIHPLVNGIDDISDSHVGGRPSQAITTSRPSNTFHQTFLAQLGKQLFQVGEGNTLTLGNLGQRHGT